MTLQKCFIKNHEISVLKICKIIIKIIIVFFIQIEELRTVLSSQKHHFE